MTKKGGSRKHGSKYPSVFKTLAGIGIVTMATGIGTTTVAMLVGKMNEVAKAAGIATTITGATIVTVAGALYVADHVKMTRSLVAPWRTFLRGYNLSP